MRHALSDFDLEILERSPIEYRRYCGRDRMERALISLGPEELQAMIDEQGARTSPAASVTMCGTSPEQI